MDDIREHQKQIVMCLTPYLLAFPHNKLSQEGLVIYAKALSELSIPAIDAAMLLIMKTSKFFPTVAEIFEAAEVMQDFVQGTGLPSPDEAWAEAIREAHDKFVYGKWELSTPEIEQAVNNFGKMALCELTPEGMNTARAQFMRIYSAICSRKKDKTVNENVLKSLPQRHVEMLIGGLAEKKALQSRAIGSVGV